MWNLKYGTDDLSTEQKQIMAKESRLLVPRQGESGIDGQFGVFGGKLLYLEWMVNGALWYSTGNCVWLSHFAEEQKLKKHYNQPNFNKKKLKTKLKKSEKKVLILCIGIIKARQSRWYKRKIKNKENLNFILQSNKICNKGGNKLSLISPNNIWLKNNYIKWLIQAGST